MSKDPSDPELTALESALRDLIPARSRLDRDRLMFEAGRASVEPSTSSRGRWAWPSLAASLAVVAITEGAVLASRPAPRVVERVVIVKEKPALPAEEGPPVVILSQAPPPAPSRGAEPSWPSESASLGLRRQVLRFGVEGLPELPPLLTHSGDLSTPSVALPESSAASRRLEYQDVLNSGDPS